MKSRIISGIVFLVWSLCLPHDVLASSTEDMCTGRADSIVVLLEKERLYLCSKDKTEGEYLVSIGRNGGGKKKRGDRKTPVGRYTLGTPRPSEKYHIFIPVGYPTREQKEKGYTGSAIGIHGPRQSFRWLGRLNTLFNWTQGCIAVAKNREIEEIARWVKRVRPGLVYIE